MRLTLGIACLLFVINAQSEQLPPLPSEQKVSSHRLFLTSEQNTQSMDSTNINIDGGYAYSLYNNIDVYVGARINQGQSSSLPAKRNKNGFLSGVSYQVTDKVSVKSLVRSYFTYESDQRINNIAAELSSRLELSDDLDLHATLDYEEWQQGVEVGLGFRF